MSRMLLSVIVLAVATLLAACTREQEKPAPQPTAAAKAAAAPAAPQPQASAGTEEVDELYVDLDADPDEGNPPLTVKFTSTIEDATPPLTYSWDFGDGSPPSTEANPTHVYQKAGEFTATLNAKDSKGITGSEEVDILVEAEQ